MSLIKTYLHWCEEHQEDFMKLKVTEKWVPVKDRPGYEVSDFGRVWSYHTNKLLKPVKQDTGYYSVTLNGKPEKLHRVVGRSFLPNPDNHPVVLHNDNDKSNNRLSNLHWGTYKENTEQAVAEGRWTQAGGTKTITWTLVSPEGQTFTTGSLKDFGNQHNLDPSCLTKVVCGHRLRHKGWTSPVCPVVL